MLICVKISWYGHLDMTIKKMEALYTKSSKSSGRIHLDDYFKRYRKFVTENIPWAFKEFGMNSENYLATIMGQPIPQMKYVLREKECSLSLLEVQFEPPPVDDAFLHGRKLSDCLPLPSNHNLRTLRVLGEDQGEFRKYGNRIWKKNPDEEQDLKVNSETFINIRVYEPIKSQVIPGLLRNYKDSSEIVVLGSQTLAQFRDAIVCSTDVTVPGELSENPEKVRAFQGKDLFKSGFIFIEDVFYNDFRHETNVDYSDSIIKWANEKKVGLFTKNELDKVHFIDLTVRFGHPYVYIHQGNCEHLIVFSNARFLHSNDPLERPKYPICLPVYGKQARYCMMCYQYLARWLVKENDRLPHDTFFFCNDCFLSFNYISGKKMGNFQAYMYQERLAYL